MGPYVPNGSYKTTSINVKVTLSAHCQKPDGSWPHSTLDLTYDNYIKVKNEDGTLKKEGSASPTPGYVPGGSYLQTSKDIRVTLSADCQKIDGSRNYSTLDITNLNNANIENRNGELVQVKKSGTSV